MVRFFGMTVVVFALLAGMMDGAQASAGIDASLSDIGISPAYANPAYIASIDGRRQFPAYANPEYVAKQQPDLAQQQPEQVALDPVAAVVPSALVLSEETQMWGGGESGPTLKRWKRALSQTQIISQKLTASALRFIGIPYVFGGTSVYGFDCSGYVQHVFNLFGIHIPRTADAQYYAGHTIHDPARGDLVFFETYLPGPSHVGIYLGNGKFVSASSRGVSISSLNERYWRRRYLGAKRLIVAKT